MPVAPVTIKMETMPAIVAYSMLVAPLRLMRNRAITS